jgi:hypothetical protein
MVASSRALIGCEIPATGGVAANTASDILLRVLPSNLGKAEADRVM